jgi:pSer/pThr/pTyr-binding forkhead associated (FHA) protein
VSSTPAEVKARLDAERRGGPFLVYRDGGGAQVIVALDRPKTIGRRPERDVALPWDTEVSRLHAQLEPVGSDWIVVDDGLSRNGTFVNGERVNGRRRLKDGDRLVFGETPVLFRAPADADADSTAAIRLGTGSAVPVTETQRKVLVALCRPLKDSAYAAPATNKAIAEEVFLSVDAVKAHLRVLFERFDLDTLPQNQKRARLAAVALVNGIVRQHDF